ncbi:MAG TPA: cupredoxin domain-containing protein [Dehalococcoidia bacterium]|nr:cupredoxin domain-containing protein [Dehalococcoidia bacterium]
MAGALALAALLLLTAACGGGEGGGGSTPTRETPGAAQTPSSKETPPAALQPQPAPAQELGATITEPQGGVLDVTAVDFAFSPNHLGASLGQTVTIRLTNNDSAPHSLRIAGPDGQYETEDDAVTEPAQVNGGGTGELSFSPQIAGAYTFRCDFHPNRMGGQIVVQ